MQAPAIRIEGLGKQYAIGRPPDDHPTLRSALSARLARVGRRAGGPSVRSFWALRNVSFEVPKGQVVGVIGNNGAGKSTLLKVLSRITPPTAGRAQIRGRVGALLEVGTGFHPELTGRENVYLNGAILGMRRAEIDRKFDEIVAFSEVESFLDTPVKHYSSGMQVRLAFAVAAHLEPEVLLVDEVLAVGDAGFQRKCLAKMQGVSREGRTVLFVSHNLGAVRVLCDRAILLRHGELVMDQPAERTVAAYLESLEHVGAQDVATRKDRHGVGDVRITRIEVAGERGVPSALTTGRPARFTFAVSELRPGMSCSFTVYDPHGQPITYFDSAPDDRIDPESGAAFACEVDELLLIPGRYRINAAITCDGRLEDHLEAAAFFEVDHGVLRGRPVPDHALHGSVVMPHRWTKAV